MNPFTRQYDLGPWEHHRATATMERHFNDPVRCRVSIDVLVKPARADVRDRLHRVTDQLIRGVIAQHSIVHDAAYAGRPREPAHVPEV